VNKYLKLLLGFVLSAAGLYYAFRKLDWAVFLEQLTQVHLIWIFLAIILMVYSVWIRALRWKLILEPIESIDTHTLFGSCMIGYFGNNVLPFRLGEILRAYSISRNRSISVSSAVGTLILERLLDMLGLITLMGFLMMIYPLTGWVNGIAYGIIFGTICLFVIILLFGKISNEHQSKIQNFVDRHSGITQKIYQFLLNIMDGLTALKNTKHVYLIIFYTIVSWAIYYIDAWMIAKALQVDIGLIGIGIVLVTATLSIIIPAAPGFIGTYHAAIVYVGTTVFALTLSKAQAFAIIIHSIGFVPFVLIGSIYFFKSSMHLSDIQKKTES